MPGYFKVPNWIIDGGLMKDLLYCDFCLMMFYCRASNKKGESWYAQDTIAKITGMSVRQVGKSSRILEGVNLLSIKIKSNRTMKITLSPFVVESIKSSEKRRSAKFNTNLFSSAFNNSPLSKIAD